MKMRSEPLKEDVPFFAFPLKPAPEDSQYLVTNHLINRDILINRQAAEVIRLADGETSLGGIVARLAERYPEAGGSDVIYQDVVDLLRYLSQYELIWWREVPVVPMPVGPPVYVFWEITAACNLRCRHCVVSAGKRLAGELPTERCLELVRELAEVGVQSIAFSGGEPLAHPDFRLLAERVHALGMMIQVATNGTLINAEVAAWLKSLGAEVQVSLDGSTPEIHNYMRLGQNAFQRTIDGIKALVEAGHRVTIGTVVTRTNAEDIPSIVELTRELGAARFRLIPFVPKGRGESCIEMELSPHDMKEITQYLHDLRQTIDIEISSLEFEEMLDGELCLLPEQSHQRRGCSGAISYATITPTGEVLPCHFFAGVRADSVASKPFIEVWQRSRFLSYFRHLSASDLHGKCQDCSWLPNCGGGCRAVNFAKGDVLGGNHHCWVV